MWRVYFLNKFLPKSKRNKELAEDFAKKILELFLKNH